MNTETRNIVTGAVVFAIFVMAVVFSYTSRDIGAGASGDYYELNAVFNRIDGLYEGDDVRLAGVRVGTVGMQRLDKNYRAVVTLKIKKDVVLPKDSSAAIHTDGLFGSKAVVLEPGGDIKNLKSGDTISFTQDSVIVSDLLNLIISEGKARRQEKKPAANGK
ncbi:MlaD family protein [Varunaivibrio sulfuroxidans]|uniref:Phospholipid/cholesterol/gamma-HCH transport system substrate-binding protein n=1 Tax=Varunaivibrio sulfuroxidans TaxID=1773489 RepID=A0A4R3J776_9PROT|nr:MlaD family protein [Varunaivibrio sulfuroxidans]TCS61252.1 phospholipid/cholesterol/gamma-HCH transport system substrate-binding protein [Varunaivibrio sulfuroxidans]WES31127.1 MlaD family protein [Varunaivibrio sulfuroxidans]